MESRHEIDHDKGERVGSIDDIIMAPDARERLYRPAIGAAAGLVKARQVRPKNSKVVQAFAAPSLHCAESICDGLKN
jgi:hypothetical protein